VTRVVVIVVALLALAVTPFSCRTVGIKVGSKKFTESVVLGELIKGLAENAETPATHYGELGGTRLVFQAMLSGDIDVYPEYTGTIIQEILVELNLRTDDQVRTALRERGILMPGPLGFNNSYAIGMRPEMADRLGVSRISDLRRHPDVRFGMSNEFMDRGDGWPSLRQAYGLTSRNVRGLDHDIAYRALDAGDIDAMDVYTTDAEISYYDLRVLEDDLSFFQTYNAVVLYRADLDTRAPGVAAALGRLEGTMAENGISRLNARVKLDGEAESSVASDFLRQALNITTVTQEVGTGARIWLRTREHLFLVVVSMTLGVIVAIPLGIVAFKRPRLGQVILGGVGMIQTIPALALLVFMIPVLGIYAPPAIAALFLYSLLPMVRNTHAGLSGIPTSVEESIEALDLPAGARLLKVELPLASRSIMAGVKTATVINIGFATLGALIGAGGYGQPILTGIRLDDTSLILEGAIPAAVLALLAQFLFGRIERVVVPKGLRLKRAA